MRYPLLTKQSAIVQKEIETLRSSLKNKEGIIANYTAASTSCIELNNKLQKQLLNYQDLCRRIGEISGTLVDSSAPSDECSVLIGQIRVLIKRN